MNITAEQLYSQFSKNVLAIYTADYLLKNELNKLSTEQVIEIEREKKLAQVMAKEFFTQLNDKGLPENLLSLHLMPFS
jgi:hypothetical protein